VRSWTFDSSNVKKGGPAADSKFWNGKSSGPPSGRDAPAAVHTLKAHQSGGFGDDPGYSESPGALKVKIKECCRSQPPHLIILAPHQSGLRACPIPQGVRGAPGEKIFSYFFQFKKT